MSEIIQVLEQIRVIQHDLRKTCMIRRITALEVMEQKKFPKIEEEMVFMT